MKVLDLWGKLGYRDALSTRRLWTEHQMQNRESEVKQVNKGHAQGTSRQAEYTLWEKGLVSSVDTLHI